MNHGSDANPWKTLSSQVIYENQWIRLREDQVIRPDGNPGIYCVVEPKKVATGVVALDEVGDVVLVGQYRYATECYSWEIVEGGAEEGENPLEGAKRELVEEAGLVADEWQELGGDLHLSNCFTSELARIYLARKLRSVPSNPDATELLQLRRVPLGEAYRMALAGEITDAVSVIGILLVERLMAGSSR